MTETLEYSPPDIVNEFIKRHLPGELFYDWIVGPFGSAKTTGMFFKLCYLASLQEPSPDGIRYSRAVVVRNTLPQLRDSTLVSWNYWFKDGEAGEWQASKNNFVLRYGDVHCEVLFRPLDTPADVARVLGLEVSFALLDEFREIAKQIVEGLSGRLGRFKPPGGVGCTNWGMWGASNPGTEDLWWYDYLHSKRDMETGRRVGCVPIRFPTDAPAQAAFQAIEGWAADSDTITDVDGNITHVNNAWYYHQPSGFSPEAENVEHLPGKRSYYMNLAKGKSKEWVKQYIEAEWGFSASGQPVVASFKAERHVSKTQLRFNPYLPLVVGTDPGLGGSAFIFMQQTLGGRLNVLGELVQRGIGAERLINERLRPYLRARFPEARVIIALDPAAANRSSNDEKMIKQTFARPPHNFNTWCETNNRLPLRLNAIDYFCNRLVEGEPALQIDGAQCPVLIRALKGGWRFGIDVKKDEIKGADPEKNDFSHPGDGFGYGCRYFHKGVVQEDRQLGRRLVPPSYRGSEYHAR